MPHDDHEWAEHFERQAKDDFIDVDEETGEVPAGWVASDAPPRPSIGESHPVETPTSYVPAVVPHETYRPQLALSAEEAVTLVNQVKAIQRGVLQEGTDYMKIPGTPKPSLLKPGAERLLQVFGLGHEMECLSIERDEGAIVGFFYRCTVHRTSAEGVKVIISTCDGYCGKDESKWAKAPINTVAKMAQKRALVGACLTATATSGLFTQDLEDLDPQQVAPKPRAAPAPPEDPNMISSKQLPLLGVLFGKIGVTARDDRLKWATEAVGRPVASSKDLTKAEASKLIEALHEAVEGHPDS